MRLLATLALVAAALAGIASASPIASAWSADADSVVSFEGHRVFRVKIAGDADIKKLEALAEEDPSIDLWTDIRPEVDVRVAPSSLSRFLDLGLEAKVIIPNLEDLIARERKEMDEAQSALKSFSAASPEDFFKAYHTYPEILDFQEDLAKRFPDLAERVNLGKTYEGREIVGLRLGKRTSALKKEFFINGGQHAREWIGIAATAYMMQEFLIKYDTDPSIKALLDSLYITIVPVMNPDGFVYTFKDRMWRKNRQPTPTARCIGIDPNRNWEQKWNTGGSSNSPCNDAYHGTKPFEAAEPRLVFDYIKSRPNMVGYADVHAYSQLWMYPYGYSCKVRAKDDKMLLDISNKAVGALTALYGTKYKVGDICNVIYQASGSSVDTVYDLADVPVALALELRDEGKYGFQLPASQILDTSRETFAGFKVVAEEIMTRTF